MYFDWPNPMSTITGSAIDRNIPFFYFNWQYPVVFGSFSRFLCMLTAFTLWNVLNVFLQRCTCWQILDVCCRIRIELEVGIKCRTLFALLPSQHNLCIHCRRIVVITCCLMMMWSFLGWDELGTNMNHSCTSSQIELANGMANNRIMGHIFIFL